VKGVLLSAVTRVLQIPRKLAVRFSSDLGSCVAGVSAVPNCHTDVVLVGLATKGGALDHARQSNRPSPSSGG
jgi:hypothetical protein